MGNKFQTQSPHTQSKGHCQKIKPVSQLSANVKPYARPAEALSDNIRWLYISLQWPTFKNSSNTLTRGRHHTSKVQNWITASRHMSCWTVYLLHYTDIVPVVNVLVSRTVVVVVQLYMAIYHSLCIKTDCAEYGMYLKNKLKT